MDHPAVDTLGIIATGRGHPRQIGPEAITGRQQGAALGETVHSRAIHHQAETGDGYLGGFDLDAVTLGPVQAHGPGESVAGIKATFFHLLNSLATTPRITTSLSKALLRRDPHQRPIAAQCDYDAMSPAPEFSPNSSTTLKRALSLPLITFYGLGNILCAGIYVLIGKVVAHAGVFAPLAFVLAALLACLTAFSYAELSARYPLSAGEAVYIKRGLGREALAALV